MRIFANELNKMIFHQKGWLIISLSITLSMCFWIVSDSPATPDMELYRTAYEEELSHVSGPLSTEKRVWIDDAFSKSFAAKQQLAELYRRYYTGLITEEDFSTQKEVLQQDANRYHGLNVLYDQYLYVRESDTNRWFLYTNGWDAFLSNDSVNLFLIVTLLLMLLPVLCREYDCQMDQLILTAENGSKTLGFLKSLLAILLASGLSLMFDGLHLVFCLYKYGLPLPSAPIQSLRTFAECIYEISLGKALGVIICVHMIGAVFLASFILAVAALTRKYAITCLTIVSALLLPCLALPDTLQYRLPLPLGWLRASGLFRGDEITISADGEKQLVFSHFTKEELVFQMITVLLLIFICCFIVWERNHNFFVDFSHLRHLVLILLVLAVLPLVGCSRKKEVSEPSPVFNSCQAAFLYGDDFMINIENDTDIIISFSDGSKQKLVRNPFREAQGSISAIYGTRKGIAYLTSNTAAEDLVRLSERENRSIYRILYIDFSTFQEKVLFEVEATKSNAWAFLSQAESFFLDNENLYFILPEEIRQVNRRTHTITALSIPASQNIAFDGSRIYYLNDAYCLAIYDPIRGITTIREDIAADHFLLGPTGIYYTDLRQNRWLCFCSLIDQSSQVLSELSVDSLRIGNDALFFTAFGQELTLKLTE